MIKNGQKLILRNVQKIVKKTLTGNNGQLSNKGSYPKINKVFF